jgi:hypothetical protein
MHSSSRVDLQTKYFDGQRLMFIAYTLRKENACYGLNSLVELQSQSALVARY